MSCESCGSNSDLARHGESFFCGTCRELGLHTGVEASERKKTYDVKLTTTPTYPNLEIEEVKGVITSECVFGMNVFRDFFAGMTDFFGGRSEASQKVLRDARETCLNELKKEAYELGANGVIGIDLDYSEISGKGKGMLFLVASGTAVKFKEEAK
ncbi:MAG TPA: YbjQ family protein [Saprospirales bacterium]|nr:YbjQ family protein [Saprospirales bacterium]